MERVSKVEIVKNKIFLEDLNYIYSKLNSRNYFKNKKVLITGSNGFIGSYLSGFFSYFIDELKISKLYFLDNSPVIKKIKSKKIKFLNKNFNNFKLHQLKVDVIIHAATIASPVFYRKFPLETCDANVLGIRKILEYGKQNKNISILFFSSSEIYGNPDRKNIPTNEKYKGNVSCVGPRACYDESKRYAETLCYIYAKYFNVSVKVVRPFNNYGPGLKINDGRAPADFANSIIKNKNIIIFSNGKTKRSFCYIADACVGFINSLSLKKYKILNIGNNKEITIKTLAKKFAKVGKEMFKYNKKIIYKINPDNNYLKDSPIRRCPDLTQAKISIKYKPKINLEKGIKKYLLFLKNEKF